MATAGSTTTGSTTTVPVSGGSDAAASAGRNPSEFDLLFARAFPAVVGLARRILDRDRISPSASDPAAVEVAVESLSRARVHHLGDTDRAVERIVGWAADQCLQRIIGHPGRVALPTGAQADQLLPADLLEDGIGAEWDAHGIGLWELQEALSGARRSDRRVGVVCLGCGMPPMQSAALLGMELDDIGTSLGRIGTRLADRRRVSAEVESPLDARLGDDG